MTRKTTNQAIPDWPRGDSKPAQRALAGAGYTRLEQLTRVTEADLLKLHGMGPKALGALREALQARGLSFAEPGEDWRGRRRPPVEGLRWRAHGRYYPKEG